MELEKHIVGDKSKQLQKSRCGQRTQENKGPDVGRGIAEQEQVKDPDAGGLCWCRANGCDLLGHSANHLHAPGTGRAVLYIMLEE